ncbi:MAG: hypothetical protein J5736_00795, partial [Bacilli bacterium]|nr:hypothetical protein [Bacilli bacterium]
SLQTSTGDVAFEDSDSPDIYIKTSTGDITGTLLTGKRFTVHVSTGKPDVPSDDPTGGICVIDTSTGDVRIRIKE